ncbi:MAG: DUF1501 domain-containing protein [Myxococcota bacterium]
MRISRRHLLAGMAAGAALGVRPRPAFAAAPDRKFIFFFAGGGWDTTTILDPHFDTGGVDMDPDTYVGEAGNLRWTAGEDRPWASRFFRRWGGRACIVNGIDAHSVGHDSAMQFVMTGTSASSFADWPTILAANGRAAYPLPHVVFSGPSYGGTLGSSVVRAGGGTLLELIDGSILGNADVAAPVPPSPADSIVDAYVHRRVAAYGAAQSGLGRARAEGLMANFERAMELEGRRFEAGLSDLGRTVLDQAIKASELFRLGLSRCAMIQIDGGYDTHDDVTQQAPQQEAFYEALDALMDHLAATPGDNATWLLDEVVIVALSEFGRTPLVNGGGGKDHWPYGSALLVGSGVAGNRVVGSTDDQLVAQAVDFRTGQPSSTGDTIGCENLGTAILKLGGLDPQAHLPEVQVLDAVIA